MNKIYLHQIKLISILYLFSVASASAAITNRWSFNGITTAAAGTEFTDLIGSAKARIVGVGATFDKASLVLPGTSNGNQPANTISAYLDLPNGIISSKVNLTVEIWAVVMSTQNNQRLFDFGRMNPSTVAGSTTGEIIHSSTTVPMSTGNTTSRDTIHLNLNFDSDTNSSHQRLQARLNGGNAFENIQEISTSKHIDSHYIMTFEEGIGSHGSSGGRITWYRNGSMISFIDVNFRLANLSDVNNWLGRSQITSDRMANIGYNEVRIYDHAFTPNEVVRSTNLGPNPSAAIAQADTITMNHRTKAAISVLANDTNGIIPLIVQAPTYGTATVDSIGRILYTHTTGSPTTDTFTYRAINVAGQSSLATATIHFNSNLRIEASQVKVPLTAPPTSYRLTNAFDITFNEPVAITSPPGNPSSLFVCEKGGQIKMISDVNATNPSASIFFDINEHLPSGEVLYTAVESGLLSLAFHPNYASNRYFYIFYSVRTSAANYNRVSRFTRDPQNPNTVAPNSEVILISQQRDRSAGNHNGGDMHFGPDAYLYISMGDEGGSNDSFYNSQLITRDLFSSVLRIDVDKKPGNLEPNAHPNVIAYPTSTAGNTGSAVIRTANVANYSIPSDNPYVLPQFGGNWNGTYNGTPIPTNQLPYVRSEIWATGLRNPWRMSFDPLGGDLWLGDVGQGQREEVNIIKKGGNYGWIFHEGSVNGPDIQSQSIPRTAPANFDTYTTRPILDYRRNGSTGFPNTEGRSVTGGIVYRGSLIPELTGSYIYGDYISGNIWSVRRSGENGATTPLHLTVNAGISAFGRDPSNGDVLLAAHSEGRIKRLIVGGSPTSYPGKLSETGLFADLSDLTPNPGVVSYSVNLPFWSDFAEKRRWFTIPALADKMTWNKDGSWGFPQGQIWVKHFDMDLTRGDPTTRRRLETRLLVRNAEGAYGVSYLWNDEGTDASLVPYDGAEFDLSITENNMVRTQRWSIPSRGSCMTCHTPQGGYALSSNTRQLNREGTINSFTGNQISLLNNAGYFSNLPQSPNLLPRHLKPDQTSFPIEARVRSYLDVNCSYCHQAGGSAGASFWDGRAHLTLDETQLLSGHPPVNNGGNLNNFLVVPGHSAKTIMLSRIAETNGFSRMPPLATSEKDQAAINLLTEWINSLELTERQTYDEWRAAHSLPTTNMGNPTHDADNDGMTNEAEFIANTHPLNRNSVLKPRIETTKNNTHVTFNVSANRSAQIETSTDLQNWFLWDVPNNNGMATAAGERNISGPKSNRTQFFRLKLKNQ